MHKIYKFTTCYTPLYLLYTKNCDILKCIFEPDPMQITNLCFRTPLPAPQIYYQPWQGILLQCVYSCDMRLVHEILESKGIFCTYITSPCMQLQALLELHFCACIIVTCN